MKHQFEDLRNKIIQRDSHIEFQNQDIKAWKDLIEALNEENNELKRTIEDVEDKNRQLGEALNTQMFQHASEYKEKMINLFRKTDSPSKANKLMQHGIQARANERMERLVDED
jgi:uncharacterized coiled-coil DUF342 family protein